MKKTTEETLKHFLRECINYEDTERLINHFSKDDVEDFKGWLKNESTNVIGVAVEDSKTYVEIGGVSVELNGNFFVIGVDTLDKSDWLIGHFKTEKEALMKAEEEVGAQMSKVHVYNPEGKHIKDFGTF